MQRFVVCGLFCRVFWSDLCGSGEWGDGGVVVMMVEATVPYAKRATLSAANRKSAEKERCRISQGSKKNGQNTDDEIWLPY